MSKLQTLSRTGKIKAIKKIMPEAFADNKVDLSVFNTLLEPDLPPPQNTVSFHWEGKNKPRGRKPFLSKPEYQVQNEKSLNSQNSKNLLIEADSLDGMRALLPEYKSKVKIIYIDPPYNTGSHQFIYKDHFKGASNKRKSDTGHAEWLNMMHPRLEKAQEMLRDDGVIFISIDENEVHHLRLLMNEVFGEENFIEMFCWVKTSTAPSLSPKSRKTVEYILCYEKNRNGIRYRGEPLEGGDAPLLNTNNPIQTLTFPKESVEFKLEDGIFQEGIYAKSTLLHDLHIKNGKALSEISLKGEFKWNQKKLDQEIKDGTTFIIKSDKFSIRFLRKSEGKYKASTNLIKEKFINPVINKSSTRVGTNEAAAREIIELMGKKYFDFSKPSSLIKHLLNFTLEDGDLVLDFFAGSGTTAQAVLELNQERDIEANFILIQKPEEIDSKSVSGKNALADGYTNICDITRARVTKVIDQLSDFTGSPQANIGFKYLASKVS